MTKTNPIAMARDFAEIAINCAMRPGAGNRDTCPSLADDTKIRRLSELYASEVLGAVGPAARAEMQALETSFRAEM